MKFSPLTVISLLLIAAVPSANAQKGHKKADSMDDDVEVLVHYKNDKGKEKLKLLANQGKVDADIKHFKTATIKTKRSKINKIAKDPDVLSVSESHTYYKFPNMRGHEGQGDRKLAENSPYGIAMVQADQLAMGDDHVTVCVVDTGYGEGHPDLPTTSQHGVQGFSPYGNNQKWNVDGDGHGTHCAGTIGAIGGNNKGVTSVNPDPTKFTFYIGKGLTNGGSGSSAGILQAVAQCVENGAKVISMSLGCSGQQCYSQTEADAYQELYDEGILIIAAAGNDGNSAKSYPASYPTVMSVGAVNSNEVIAGFSQYNDQVEISAPGVSTLSTITTNNGKKFDYASWSGTSMATPHVAGVAALVWSHFPECSNNQIRNVLIKTALDRGDAGCDVKYGFGIVQAKAAYDLLSAEGCDAGGVDPGQLSNAARGGCEQDPDYVPPPTAAPTPFACDDTTVTVELTTDAYGAETSWELTDFNNVVQASGGGYQGNTDYEINTCVTETTCKFTIKDSYNDGICCSYGSGSYAVIRDGVKYEGDGNFGSSDSITICPTPAPSPAPTPAPTPCSGAKIQLSVMTDSNPGQTRIRLRDNSNKKWILKTNWNYFAEPWTLYTEEVCYDEWDVSFRLQVDDKGKDGFEEGGYYSLVINGVTIHDERTFNGRKDISTFNGTPPGPVPTGSPTLATPAPSAAPSTPLPSEEPSITPSDVPSTTPSEAPTACPGLVAKLSLLTDGIPGDTSWSIVDWLSDGEVEVGGPYTETNTMIIEEMCLPESCYVFTIKDNGDGDFDGSYTLEVDGQVLVSDDSGFTSAAYTLFGSC